MLFSQHSHDVTWPVFYKAAYAIAGVDPPPHPSSRPAPLLPYTLTNSPESSSSYRFAGTVTKPLHGDELFRLSLLGTMSWW